MLHWTIWLSKSDNNRCKQQVWNWMQQILRKKREYPIKVVWAKLLLEIWGRPGESKCLTIMFKFKKVPANYWYQQSTWQIVLLPIKNNITLPKCKRSTFTNCVSRLLGSREVVKRILGFSIPALLYSSSIVLFSSVMANMTQFVRPQLQAKNNLLTISIHSRA